MNDKKILKYAKELGVTPKRLQEIIDDINFLTEEEEKSLDLAMKSPKSEPMNSEEMMSWLKK
jgi:hypothetical protein